MTVYILNLFDAASTLYAVNRGAVELNPAVRWLLQWPAVFVGYKVLVVGGLLWWLSRRPERAARVGLCLCAAVYGGICINNLFALLLIVGH